MKRILIVCGGTGGHLSPGIAIAERLIERGIEPTLIISRKQVDTRLCQSYPHLRFEKAPGVAFSWHPVRLIRFILHALQSFIFAFRMLRKIQPEVVLVYGGYLSLGHGLAAWLMNFPLAIHEANRAPGKAVRFLGRFADRIYLPAGLQLPGVSPRTIHHMGYPLRKNIQHISKENARRRLGIPRHEKLLLVMGGSQGAAVLNLWVNEQMSNLSGDGIHIYCITGLGKGKAGVIRLQSDDGHPVHCELIPFYDDMALLMSAADIAISRAGAGSIAELVACLTPSILIPYPHAADNHQLENARFLERQGGCIVLEQKDLSKLYREVNELIFNDWLLDRMRYNLRMLQRGDVAQDMAADLLALARRMQQDGTQEWGAAAS